MSYQLDPYLSLSGADLKSAPQHRDIFLQECPSTIKNVAAKENLGGEEQEVTHLTAFGKACYDLTHSERVMDDLTFGRRVGLYELRGEIGSGNFSRVRYGIHDLTKGEILRCLTREHSAHHSNQHSYVACIFIFILSGSYCLL